MADQQSFDALPPESDIGTPEYSRQLILRMSRTMDTTRDLIEGTKKTIAETRRLMAETDRTLGKS